VNIRQSYKQERDCFVHFLRLIAAIWPTAQSFAIVDPTQFNPPKTEKSRPNPTEPMGQPNPWTTLVRWRVANRCDELLQVTLRYWRWSSEFSLPVTVVIGTVPLRRHRVDSYLGAIFTGPAHDPTHH